MIRYKLYKSYNELPNAWDETESNDLMLSISYFKALESASPSNIKLYYVGVFNNETLVAKVIVQHVRLYLKDMFRNSSSSKLKTFLRDFLSLFLKGNILVVGNLTHTGQHGIYYASTKIKINEVLNAIFDAMDALKKQIKTEYRKKIRLIMFKDYFLNDPIQNASNVFDHTNFYKVKVQPNMVLDIRPKWLQIEDYIADLNKKYRTRYKRARKKFDGIERRELSLEDVMNNATQLHSLYSNVSNNAKFNTFYLPYHHFYSFKKELQDNLKVFGYYLDGELIGFYTLILNHQSLETYFLGYDSEHQYSNQLYLNMLYDMLDFGIKHQFKSIVYARTAMEIKSSVGAKALPMVMYMKHTNSMANKTLKVIFNFMKPNKKWDERHPFS
ncbi:acetyltransferase (GNAT) family protein [Flavobacteriaceae bacterium MAR_2010_72]|nr:acetyltransferase (GNAT) family protein [Flavobacteriaceae bacterium MAR_2010_72]TVZ58306.1 acetyltransferase (GNAT) family protein [Flavobacteriaceae bacterium MAR_2010_105]